LEAQEDRVGYTKMEIVAVLGGIYILVMAIGILVEAMRDKKKMEKKNERQ
jgi:hypothetical protein